MSRLIFYKMVASGWGEMLNSLDGHRAGFLAELPVQLATRRDRIRRALALIEDNRIELCDALLADGGHNNVDAAEQADIEPALTVLRDALRNIESWMHPASGLLDRFIHSRYRIDYQPVGVVGFAASPSLPVRQTADLLAGALAAGNRVVVKLDAATPSLGRLLEGLALHYFDPLELTVLNGGPQADAAFARLPFDQIGGDGSAPLPMERSGKSPAIIGRSADFARTAEKVIADKLARAGRMPLAPDYLLVPAEREDEIAGWLWRAAMHLAPRLPEANAGAPFSNEERQRIARLIEDARARGAEILVADHPDTEASRRSMPLSIVRFATDDMLVMREEIRGPILPLRNYGSIDEAIGEIQRRPPPPAIYHFGRDAVERREVLDRTVSSAIALDGHAPRRAGFLAASDLTAPRGPGEESFRRFSRLRRICRQPIENLREPGGKAVQDPLSVPAAALQ